LIDAFNGNYDLRHLIKAIELIGDPQAIEVLEKTEKAHPEDTWLRIPAVLSHLHKEARNEQARAAKERQIGEMAVLASSGSPEALQSAFDLLGGDESLLQDKRICSVLALAWKADALKFAVGATTSKSAAVKRVAFQLLGRSGDSEFFNVLVSGLKDNDWQTQLPCIQGLGAMRDLQSAEVLLQTYLASPPWGNAWIREECAKSLIRQGPEAARFLTGQLPVVPVGDRAALLQCIAQTADATSISGLVETLMTIHDQRLRISIYSALENIDLAWTHRPEARSAVPRVVGTIVGGKANEKQSALEVAKLLLTKQDIEFVILNAAVRAPTTRNTELARQLLAIIDPDWARAAEAKASTASLLKELADASSVIRSRAVEFIGDVGTSDVLPRLLDLRLNDPANEVQVSAAKALDKIEPQWSGLDSVRSRLSEFVAALRSPSAWVRAGAASILGRMGDESTLPQLVEALGEQDTTAAHAVRSAIVGFDVAALPFLIDSLGRPDIRTRVNASQCVRALGPRAASAVAALASCLEENAPAELHLEAVRALTAIGPEAQSALPAILPIWRSLKLDDSMAAFRALGDCRAVDPVLRYLYESPAARDESKVRATLRALIPVSAVNEQFIEWAIRASGFEHKYRGYKYDAGFITLESSDEAIRSLCSVKLPISSNLLHLISNKKDISVRMDTGCSNPWDEAISFAGQRQTAKQELALRGNPSYSQDAYSRNLARGIADQTTSALAAEKTRRYQALCDFIKNPRSDRGEDKWKYYDELAADHPNPEVLRLVTADFARHRTIKPSEMSHFEALLAKIGARCSENQVSSTLASISQPWPNSHAKIRKRIAEMRSGKP
jgi:HEAT repeat protein